MKYFLGMDVGATKTHALIADQSGSCIGFGKAEGGNHQDVGYRGLEKVLLESFQQALKTADISRKHITSAGFGVAGYDFPSDRGPHLKAISKLRLTCPVEVVNDGVNGLLAGTTHGIGINVTAGSSNNCRGRNKHGKEGRIVGNGGMFGEFGGGLEIVMQALQRVNHAWIQRLPPTSLTDILLKATGARNELDLMEGLSNGTYRLLASTAIEIIKAAQTGDADAAAILHWAGEELGWLAVSVARQIQIENEEVEIVQSGSLFVAGEIITQPMRGILMKHIPKARLIRLDGPPVIGAILLGMEQVEFDGYAVRENMVETAKDIIK